MQRAPKRFNMPDREPPFPSFPDSRAVPRTRTRLSLVWFIPILAALVGAWVAVARIRSEGPKITIVFRSAEGLEAGKTKINYRGVDIGVLSTIRLSEDRHRANGAQDRGLSSRGHKVLGGATADLRRQRERSGHAHLGGLHRDRNWQLEGREE